MTSYLLLEQENIDTVRPTPTECKKRLLTKYDDCEGDPEKMLCRLRTQNIHTLLNWL